MLKRALESISINHDEYCRCMHSALHSSPQSCPAQLAQSCSAQSSSLQLCPVQPSPAQHTPALPCNDPSITDNGSTEFLNILKIVGHRGLKVGMHSNILLFEYLFSQNSKRNINDLKSLGPCASYGAMSI